MCLVNDTLSSFTLARGAHNMLPFIPHQVNNLHSAFFFSFLLRRLLISRPHTKLKECLSLPPIMLHWIIHTIGIVPWKKFKKKTPKWFRYAQFFIFNFMHNHWPFIIFSISLTSSMYLSAFFCIVRLFGIGNNNERRKKLWIRKWSLI